MNRHAKSKWKVLALAAGGILLIGAAPPAEPPGANDDPPSVFAPPLSAWDPDNVGAPRFGSPPTLRSVPSPDVLYNRRIESPYDGNVDRSENSDTGRDAQFRAVEDPLDVRQQQQAAEVEQLRRQMGPGVLAGTIFEKAATEPGKVQIDHLRTAAEQLDQTANQLERLELFSQADQIRATADRLRRDARRLARGETLDKPSRTTARRRRRLQ